MIPSRYKEIEKTQKEINKVLDKIRAEIEQKEFDISYVSVSDVAFKAAYIEVLKIIDKYKA